MRLCLLFLSTLIFATPALAIDGVLEINQTCAVQTGCFPGDAAGFPVTIATTGSYQLTGNLAVPDANTSGVDITTDGGVTLDLAGFVIAGTNDCSGYPAVCTEAGSGCGVDSHVPDLSEPGEFRRAYNVTLRDGIVRGHGNAGARLGNNAYVEGVHALGNRWYGIWIKSNSILRDSRAVQNGYVGLKAGFANSITGNVAASNGFDGITANGASVLSKNAAQGNGGKGFELVGSGISAIHNTSADNSGAGIAADSRSTLIGNTVTGNAVGLSLQTVDPPGYAQNIISANTGAAVSGGVALECNIIDGARVCPP